MMLTRRPACHRRLWTYSRIKQPPADPEERPRIHEQTEAIHKRRKDIPLAALPPVSREFASLGGEHDLTCERKVEEEERSNEFP